MPQVYAGQRITAAVLSEDYTQADATSHTVTAASYTALSTTYTIAANDMATAVAYRLTAFGNGTWGSTQQQLDLGFYLAGSLVTNSSVAAAALSASAAFRWKAISLLICVSTGSSGSLVKLNEITVNESANPLNPGTASTNAIAGCSGTGTTTVNTTVSNAWEFRAEWASTTGSPTITCQGTIFERLGG